MFKLVLKWSYPHEIDSYSQQVIPKPLSLFCIYLLIKDLNLAITILICITWKSFLAKLYLNININIH